MVAVCACQHMNVCMWLGWCGQCCTSFSCWYDRKALYNASSFTIQLAKKADRIDYSRVYYLQSNIEECPTYDMMAEDQQAYLFQHNKHVLATVLTGKSTLTSVPSSKDTRQVMIDFASPAAGMCVVARWASLNRVFSACFRMERRPSVLRRKLSMMGGEGGLHYHTWKRREQHLQNLKELHRNFILRQFWQL